MPTQLEKNIAKKVAAANKICEDWKNNSKQYAKDFEGIRKVVLPIKRDLNQITKDVGKNIHITNGADDYKSKCEKHLKELQRQLKIGNKLFVGHDKWKMGGPRSSMTAIAKKLKLGGARDPIFEAVAEGIGNQLTLVAKVLRGTDFTWTKDVLILIENQIERSETLLNILTGAEDKRAEFLSGLEKRRDRFLGYCDGLRSEYIKASSARNAMNATGFPAETNIRILKQNSKVFVEKIKRLRKIPKEMEKNYTRVWINLPRPMSGTREVAVIMAEARAKMDTIQNEVDEAITVFDDWLRAVNQSGRL